MNKKQVIKRLKSILNWSDRIGSDEIYEIHDIINLLEGNKEEDK